MPDSLNPWEKIALEDYEHHMQLDSVRQLQALNAMMERQLSSYPAASVMILGVAGGNGLGHLHEGQYRRIYGIDINASYLQRVKERYPHLGKTLQCLKLDLTKQADQLPAAELLIADLLIEYIGYECFQTAVRCVRPRFVSCIIQVSPNDGWVSDSPYLHVFDELDTVHHQISEDTLTRSMQKIGHIAISRMTCSLPDGKKLVQLDFARPKRPYPADKPPLKKS